MPSLVGSLGDRLKSQLRTCLGPLQIVVFGSRRGKLISANIRWVNYCFSSHRIVTNSWSQNTSYLPRGNLARNFLYKIEPGTAEASSLKNAKKSVCKPHARSLCMQNVSLETFS